MRELAVVCVLAAAGLIGVEYVALTIACLAFGLVVFSLTRLAAVGRELKAVTEHQKRTADQMCEKAATINSEIRADAWER